MKSFCFLLFCALAMSAHATGSHQPMTPAASHAQAQAAALALSAAYAAPSTSSATVAPGAVVASPVATANAAPSTSQATGLAPGAIGVQMERSAPGVVVSAPVQVRNCRLGIGAGGSNVTGSFSAAIVIGNDQTCLSGAQIELMTAANVRATNAGQPLPFTPADFVRSACAVEGMGEAEACKAR